MKRFLGCAAIPVRSKLFPYAAPLVILSLVFMSLAGCATILPYPQPQPPVLAQDEVKKPYIKIGVVECSKESFGSIDALAPADYDWAYGELREAARRIGADAIITPELRVEQDTFILFPTSTIKAKGIAIRFR
jgi:hypothetical protein